MQGRHPQSIVILVEGLVGPLESDAAVEWMERRAAAVKAVGVSSAVVYQKLRSSGTMAKPRFFSVFETSDPASSLAALTKPYEHPVLRPLGAGAFQALSGLPRVSNAEPDGGLMVGLTNCTDPGDEADFNAWYDRVHAADVIKSPWFWSAERFRRLEGDLPQYAALYETSLRGSDALKQYMGWPERETDMHARIANVHVWSFDFLAAL